VPPLDEVGPAARDGAFASSLSRVNPLVLCGPRRMHRLAALLEPAENLPVLQPLPLRSPGLASRSRRRRAGPLRAGSSRRGGRAGLSSIRAGGSRRGQRAGLSSIRAGGSRRQRAGPSSIRAGGSRRGQRAWHLARAGRSRARCGRWRRRRSRRRRRGHCEDAEGAGEEVKRATSLFSLCSRRVSTQLNEASPSSSLPH
jgi:hypothetical protein